jgi:hypothetical protein
MLPHAPSESEVLPPAQTGPAAWRGAELASRTDWVEPLDATGIAELDAAMRAFLGRGGEVAARLGRITAQDFPLPRLGPRLAALRTELLQGRGFVLLRRLPVERYTPAERATLFMGLGAHLGRARSQNAQGHVLGGCTRRASARPSTPTPATSWGCCACRKRAAAATRCW